MKKLLGAFVVLLAIAASAFTVKQHPAKTGNSYTYVLYGTSNQDDPDEIIKPANYTFTSTGSLGCVGDLHRCGVEDAMDDGNGHPDFTQSFTPKVRN
ncbi:MAG: hypothetical protein JWQ27_257 [Ferruginibacter sp.]|nr:hypothetical protein [Ferruginibacter sp.]